MSSERKHQSAQGSAAILEQLLTSNVAPEDDLHSELADTLRHSKRRREELLEKANTLLAEVEDLEALVGKTSTILNPVRRVPSDILREIFLYCLPEQALSTSSISSNLSIRKPPWTLAQVSSGWRRVALGFPRLWARIAFHSYRSHQNTKNILLCQLLRSGTCHLDVSISCFGSSSRDNYFTEIAMLAAHAHRIRSLTMATHDGLMCQFFAPASGHFEALQLMHVHSPIDSESTTCDIFLSTPSLRIARLDSAPHLSIPWTQLTKCTINDDAQVFPLADLSRANNLKYLSIPLSALVQNPDTPIIFRSLESLVLYPFSLAYGVTPQTGLTRLQAPALKTLTLSTPAHAARIRSTLDVFLNHSKPQVLRFLRQHPKSLLALASPSMSSIHTLVWPIDKSSAVPMDIGPNLKSFTVVSSHPGMLAHVCELFPNVDNFSGITPEEYDDILLRESL